MTMSHHASRHPPTGWVRLLPLLCVLGVPGALAALCVPGCAQSLSATAIAVRVDCNVPDATLWIDDALVGTTASWKGGERQIRAGFHRIEVRHPGYYSFFQEVELPGGSHVIVTAKLRELVE
jgi:PEGA domain